MTSEKEQLHMLMYEDSTQEEARAAEQWAVAYVAQVGVSKKTMIDAISTLRAVVMAYDRKLSCLAPAPESHKESRDAE